MIELTKAPPKLAIHYAPGMLVVLRRVNSPVIVARSYGLDTSEPRPHWAVARPPTFLEDDESSWCLERCYVPRESPMEISAEEAWWSPT